MQHTRNDQEQAARRFIRRLRRPLVRVAARPRRTMGGNNILVSFGMIASLVLAWAMMVAQ